MTTIKIILIHPPIRLQEPPRHIPFGIAELAAVADELGYQVAVLDLNAFRIGLDAVRQELRRDEWDVVGIGGLVTQYKFIKQIVPIAREIRPKALIVLGGGVLTCMPKKVMQLLPEVDVGVIGEGENTWVELLETAFSRRFRQVKGLIYRHNAKLRITKPRPLIGMKDSGQYETLDDLPYPAYDLLPLEVYFQNSPIPLSPEALTSKRRMSLVSERGCPFSCTFCVHNGLSARDLSRIYKRSIKGPAVRFQSARYVVDHIKYLRLKYAVDFVSILDENLTSNRKRCLEFCDLLEEEDLVPLIKWGCLGHVATVDYPLLQRMKDCGCTYISYGGESADQRMLDAINKKQTPEQMQAAVDATIKAEINPIMTFMFNIPGEDIQAILTTVKFWRDNQIQCKPFFLQPYPGTQDFLKHRDTILKQYEGKLEAYLEACDDATELTVNLTNFTDVELIGLRELAFRHDINRIEKWAKEKGLLKNEKQGT